MSRKTIRDGIAAEIATIYLGDIYTTRAIDARELEEYVNVFIASGGPEEDAGMLRQTAARMVVTYAKKGATDDQLDTVAEAIEDLLDAADLSAYGVAGVFFQEFQYAEDDDQFEKLHLTYTIIY